LLAAGAQGDVDRRINKVHKEGCRREEIHAFFFGAYGLT
jgi:hypothetical protein